MEYLNLDQFKASGIYTIEIDASQTLTIPLTTGRLLLGSSRRGPINTVVLVNDPKVGRNVYGSRDYFLENRGSYFHKYMSVMLNEGPIYAMNVVPVDLLEDDYDGAGYLNKDRAGFVPFNAEAASFNDQRLMFEFKPPVLGPTTHTAPLKNYYNRQKFWYASDVELAKTKNKVFSVTPVAANDVISVANLGKRPVTVFIQKASVTGFDLTAKEWYSNVSGENVKPDFVHQDDMISDYMIDVIVVEGDWTNYLRLAVDPVYGSYFTERGLKTSKINDFLSIGDVVTVTRQVGCMIPDFIDKAGRNIAIDRVFNNQYPLTELIMSLDFTRLEQYDLTTDAFSPTSTATYRMDILGHGASELALQTGSIPDDSYDLHANFPADYTIVNAMIDTLSYRKPLNYQYSFIYRTTAATLITDVELYTLGSPALNKLKAYEDSKLYKLWKSGHLVSGDYNPVFGGSPAAKVYIKILGPYEDVLGKYVVIEGYSDKSLSIPDSLSVDAPHLAITFITCQSGTSDTPVALYDMQFDASATLTIQKVESNKLRLVIDNSVSADVFNFIKPGYYLQAKVNDGRPRVLRILNVAKVTSSSPTSTYEVITMLPNDPNVDGIDVGDNTSTYVKVSKGIYNYVSEIRGYKITEFTLRMNPSMPDGTAVRQSDIYKFLFDSGLDKAITSGEPLDVRHMVDSYDGEISNASKYNIVRLGAVHAKTLVFVNGPSMKQFEDSTDPTFVDPFNGLLNAQYIADGGNFQFAQPSFTYKLASGIEKGVPIESFAIYSIPNLIIRENNKNKSMPGAAYVSNAYIRKFKSGNPYGLVAGKRGVIIEPEVIGVEYDLTDDDRKILEPVGYNLLIKRRGIGTMLFTNNTAYQRVQSALNNAHVRDTLITIEKDVERILYNFLFDFNDGITQIRVKTLVENYLDNILTARGISWYSVTMDSANNTNEVMEANAGVIDIYVDFPRGIHKFINRITITRKGGQLSATQSGFGIAA